ncbi:sensor histidine kinase [Brevibacillus ruminantium]|uniref:histidine kinase n=1 Tax=Brevibacillus ruminantium TaxID=2950604 RepID=A0ABY4WJI8_9BACL|nr:sensor histidine kinase [Brevibacillus ruminantium]USG67044.1 sensor histidine kinase [Brevibacillus ruminantium]
MLIVKDILLQLLIILVPAVLYKSIWLDRMSADHSRGAILLTFLSSMTVLFCMSFPIQVNGDLQYDLRSIPVMGAILYGGTLPGIITSAVMLLYRVYIGGEGVLVAFFNFAIYGPPLFMIMSRWEGLSQRKKLTFILLIACLNQLALALGIAMVFYSNGDPTDIILHNVWTLLHFSLVAVLASILYVYLIEFIRESFFIRSQLIRSEKLKLISELAASVAHEVRNPLTVVRGFIQLLREEAHTKNEAYFKLVLGELDRAEFIISDYLSLAKPQADVPSKVGMAETVTDVTALITSYALMKKVELRVTTESGLYVYGNSVRIKQALLNLMKNGIESMKQGGILEIEAKQSRGYVVVMIRDQGEGMTVSQIEQVGFPFYSTKEKGTGLGLMVTCRIVEAMGGKLEFQSDPGKGTCVKVCIPAL